MFRLSLNMAQKGRINPMSWQFRDRLYDKWFHLESILIPQYIRAIKKIIGINEKLFRQMDRRPKEKLVNDFVESSKKLGFIYEDICIHLVIFLDLLSIRVSNGSVNNFYGINKHSIPNTLSIKPKILAYKPKYKILRQIRNKYFEHAEVIRPLGPTMTLHSERQEIKFMVGDALKRREDLTDKDISFIEKMQQKYKTSFPKLELIENQRELLMSYIELSIQFSDKEIEILKEMLVRCFLFLPDIKTFYNPVFEMVNEMRLFKRYSRRIYD